MKKFSKIFILLLCSFLFIYEINAEEQDKVCDGQVINYIEGDYKGDFIVTDEKGGPVSSDILVSYNTFVKRLHDFEWNVIMPVPDYDNCTSSLKSSSCSYTSADMAKMACYDYVTDSTSSSYYHKSLGVSVSGSVTRKVFRPCNEGENGQPPGILCKIVCTGTVRVPNPHCIQGDYSKAACNAYGYDWDEDATKEVPVTKEKGGEDGKITSSEAEEFIEGQNAGVSNVKCTSYFRTEWTEYTCDLTVKPYEVQGIRDFMYTTKGDLHKDGTRNDIAIYCVTPDDRPLVKANVYEVDATKCESSNSTADCGFSNIMIEGYYRAYYKYDKNNPENSGLRKEIVNNNYNTKVITLAMRIWATHLGMRGFNYPGIAEKDDTNINNMYSWISFMPTGSKVVNGKKVATYPNIYKQSENAILKKIFIYAFDSATKDIYDVESGAGVESGLKDVLCKKLDTPEDYGVVCTDEEEKVDSYIYAYYLFINTVQGNNKMQEHLFEINHFIYGQDNEDEYIDNSPSNATVEFNEDEKTIEIVYQLQKGVEIDCSTLDEDEWNDYGCSVTQRVVITDKNGNEISEDINAYDYCKKNYCYKEIIVDPGKAKCDIIDRVVVETETRKKCGSKSVKRYESCVDPDDQLMYSFEPDPSCETEGGTTKTPLPAIIICEGCNINSRLEKPECEGEDNEGIATGMAGDPSLNCILHKTSFNDENGVNMPTDASYYDYSKEFGVNTDVCRVYCSDKVEYYLPDKQYAANSLQLKYDIESRVFKDRAEKDKSPHALTSVVMVKRECVSEIFYNNVFDYYMDWKKAYDLDVQPTNIKELYDALSEKAAKEADRTEVLNNLVFDLYNCNLFTKNEISKSGVGIPKDATFVVDNALELLANTDEYCTNNVCVKGSVTYGGGAQYMEEKDGYYFTGQNGVDPALTADVDVYTNNGDTSDKAIRDVLELRYCGAGSCFRGSRDEKTNYINDNFDEDYDAATSDSQFVEKTLGKNSKKKIKVPSNDYAIFGYTIEADLYNSTRYYTEQYTGNVKVRENSEEDDTYVILDPYLYPIAGSVNPGKSFKDVDDAFKCTPILASDGKTINYDCNIFYKMNPILYKKLVYKNTAFTRKSETDFFQKAIDELNNFACKYSVTRTPETPECPPNDPSCPDNGTGGEMFAYKNIDLERPFPVKRTGTNWDFTSDNDYSRYVSEIVKEIEESGKNNLYATDEYLEYSYVLTPETIESIRVYNSGHVYYDKPTGCTIDGDKYFDCNSEFLDYLHDDSNPLQIIINKSDGISKYTSSKEVK